MKRYYARLFSPYFRKHESLILGLTKPISTVFPFHKKRSRFLQLFACSLCTLFITSCNQRKSGAPLLDNIATNLMLMPTTNSSLNGVAPPLDAKAVDNSGLKPALVLKEIMLQETLELIGLKKSDLALEKVNLIIEANPQYLDAYSVRGRIYTDKHLWYKAQEDYETILNIDGNNSVAKFDLVELKFMQKAYTDARPLFVAMEKDPDLGDLASYKVFLCDLFSGHEDIAHNELEGFNISDSKPSYYFGNVAWSLYHHRVDDARAWLQSAMRIYSPQKIYAYSSNLIELGYLPLPNESK